MTFPEWLPEPLAPIAARLARVDDCIGDLVDQAGWWSFNDPLELQQLRRSDGRYRVVVAGVRPIPPSIAILFSEATHHLRAALDNTVWYLVEQEMGVIDEQPGRLVAMPIFDSVELFDKWAARRRPSLPALGDASSQTHQRVRALQPFCDDTAVPSVSKRLAAMIGIESEHAHPLSLLQGYSNLDKHREIRMSVNRTIITRGDLPLDLQDRSFRELTAGVAVSPDGDWGSPVPTDTSAAVMVRRPEPWTAVVSPALELQALRGWVRNVALPQLLTGSQEVSEAIPVTIELGDDGRTLRERIEQPTRPSAHTRTFEANQTRLAEALTRPVQWPTVVDVDFED